MFKQLPPSWETPEKDCKSKEGTPPLVLVAVLLWAHAPAKIVSFL